MTAGSFEFSERLAVELTLTIGRRKHRVPGGSVVHLALDLVPYGAEGVVEFLVQDDRAHGGGFDDALNRDFLGRELAEVTVEVAQVHQHPEARGQSRVRCVGVAVARSVVEVVYRGMKELPILVRRYRVEFVDPARALWSQHFPCELYTHTSLKKVLDAHRGDKIDVRCQWGKLEEIQPIIFVHLPVEGGASFYDFVLWYADRHGGSLVYDHATGRYTLADRKSPVQTADSLFGDDIGRCELVVPDPPRHQPVVLNHYAGSPRAEPIRQAHAVAPLRHDLLMSSVISQAVDDRVTSERSRLARGDYEAVLDFARWPVVDVMPGAWVDMPARNRWSRESALVGVTWRIRDVRLRATAPPGPLDRDAQLANTGFAVEISARLEQRDDERAALPGFRAPCYPGYVEGKVVSDQGREGDKTHQAYTNEESSVVEYKVRVPLWGDQQVAAPFEPQEGSGNVFLPSYRDERVLLAIGPHHARIARLLEWRAGAALSSEEQGQQVLFGVSDTSHTSMRHVYDADRPVFNLERTHERDTALIQLKEGVLFVQVKEKEG